jgi:hypothetical protein
MHKACSINVDDKDYIRDTGIDENIILKGILEKEIQLAQPRVQLWTLVNMVINIHAKVWNFFTS